MNYYYNLYLDGKTALEEEKIRDYLEHDKWQLEVYLVILSKSEKNQLEICHSALFLQKKLKSDDVFVVGIAKGYQEALKLVEKITQDVYDETKTTDLKSYIIKKQQEFQEGIV